MQTRAGKMMWTLRQANVVIIGFLIPPLLWGCSSLRSDVVVRKQVDVIFAKDLSDVGVDNKLAFLDRGVRAAIPGSYFAEDSQISLERMRSELSKLGVSRTQILDLGVYGKLESKVIFVADRQLIPNYDRLYWVMVRVLSEKYGCFIKQKINQGDSVQFTCRDKRHIVMKRSVFKRYVAFQSRQYDAYGREIKLKQKSLAENNRPRFAAGLPAQGYRRNP